MIQTNINQNYRKRLNQSINQSRVESLFDLLAVHILEDKLFAWTNLGNHLLFIWLCASILKTGTRRIIRLHELSFVVCLQRIAKENVRENTETHVRWGVGKRVAIAPELDVSSVDLVAKIPSPPLPPQSQVYFRLEARKERTNALTSKERPCNARTRHLSSLQCLSLWQFQKLIFFRIIRTICTLFSREGVL